MSMFLNCGKWRRASAPSSSSVFTGCVRKGEGGGHRTIWFGRWNFGSTGRGTCSSKQSAAASRTFVWRTDSQSGYKTRYTHRRRWPRVHHCACGNSQILNASLAMSKNYLRNKTEFLACTACVQWPHGWSRSTGQISCTKLALCCMDLATIAAHGLRSTHSPEESRQRGKGGHLGRAAEAASWAPWWDWRRGKSVLECSKFLLANPLGSLACTPWHQR